MMNKNKITGICQEINWNLLWFIGLFLSALVNSSLAGSDIPIAINQESLSQAPVIDGQLGEWGEQNWHKLLLKPAQDKPEQKLPEQLEVLIKTTVIDNHFYFAAKWADEKADLEYKNWIWRGNKYRRGKKLDDMFALRFDMDGDYDHCMISEKNYKVDLWLWSSARSNHSGYAEDMYHIISTRYIENAAEYENKQGKIVYIKKKKDSGKGPYKYVRIKRKKKQEAKMPSVELIAEPHGSIIDVKAKGRWVDGYWHLEMARELNTNNSDDVNLANIKNIRGSIAVFNHNASENKNKSQTLMFQLQH